MTLSFIGSWIVPFVYVFSGAFDFADYHLPLWSGVAGVIILMISVWLLWKAHRDLGSNWSPSLEISREQQLVTSGIYSYIRHPVYAAFWLSSIAQALLLQNWIGGFAGLATFTPTYFLRVPREEQMMADRFGREYRAYMSRTGRVIPRG